MGHPRANAGNAMCDKCIEFDKRIDHYRRLVFGVQDQMMQEGAAKLIAELEAKKADLHPEQK
jgi:hypothetical protein